MKKKKKKKRGGVIMGRDYYYRYFCKSICMNLRRMAVSAVNLTSAPRIVTNERIGEKKKERKKGKKGWLKQ